jgi:hypothetical protein
MNTDGHEWEKLQKPNSKSPTSLRLRVSAVKTMSEANTLFKTEPFSFFIRN